MRLRIGFLLSFAVMTIVVCASVQGLAELLLDVDFENVAVGALPEGFQVVGGTPGVTDEINGASGIKTLRIAPLEPLPTNTYGDYVVCAFPSQSDGMVIEFSFYYKDAGSKARYLCFGAFSGLEAAPDMQKAGPYLAIVEGGNMRYFDGAFHDIARVAPGVWHRVRLVVDIRGQRWDIYVDDMSAPKVTGARFRKPADRISALAFTVYQLNVTAGTSYVDDIRVFSGEPAALSLEI